MQTVACIVAKRAVGLFSWLHIGSECLLYTCVSNSIGSKTVPVQEHSTSAIESRGIMLGLVNQSGRAMNLHEAYARLVSPPATLPGANLQIKPS